MRQQEMKEISRKDKGKMDRAREMLADKGGAEGLVNTDEG
jgi:hypothetical protein